MSKVHWLALASIRGLGGVTASKLIDKFGNVESILAARDQELISIPRFNETMVQELRALSLEPFEQEIYALAQDEIDVLTWDDAQFPKQLRALPDPPLLLFMRGTFKKADENAVAIVGTRSPSTSSAEFTFTLARELALRGLTIVSGLALGIDSAAHNGALDAEDGRTIGVLGSGIRMIHPRENAELAERIACHGALLSELMPNTPPRGPQLMARDRLISGLSRAVIVVQAVEDSGSLDTARHGRKQKRFVYAVSGSPGTEALIKGGASRIDPERVDFDTVAETIYTYTIEPETPAPPLQQSLF